MKKLFILFAALGLALLCRASWLQFQGNVQHTGLSEDSVVINNLLWQDSLAPMDLFAGPVTYGELVFVPTTNGFYCLSTRGDSLWCQLGSFSGVPAIIDDRIVVVQAETLRCFTPDGELLWSLGFPVQPSHPTVADGVIYLTAGRKVYAIDSTGIPRWASVDLRYGFNLNMTPCCYDTFVVVVTKGGSLVIDPASVVYILDRSTGVVINSRDYGYGFAELGCQTTPSLINQRLYFTTRHSTLFPGYGRSVQLPENTQHWEIRGVPTYHTSSVASDSRVFFVGEGLRAYDSTNKSLWTANLGKVSYSSPLISSGIIWVGNDVGVLFGVDAASGLIRHRFQCGTTPLTSPATTSDGRLIICDLKGHVYCFGYISAVEEPLYQRESPWRPGIYDITGRRLKGFPTNSGVYFHFNEDGSRQKIVLH